MRCQCNSCKSIAWFCSVYWILNESESELWTYIGRIAPNLKNLKKWLLLHWINVRPWWTLELLTELTKNLRRSSTFLTALTRTAVWNGWGSQVGLEWFVQKKIVEQLKQSLKILVWSLMLWLWVIFLKFHLWPPHPSNQPPSRNRGVNLFWQDIGSPLILCRPVKQDDNIFYSQNRSLPVVLVFNLKMIDETANRGRCWKKSRKTRKVNDESTPLDVLGQVRGVQLLN